MRKRKKDVDPSDITNVMKMPVIHGYKIGKRIGAGATALIFKGIHTKTNRKVAIKVLKPSQEVDENSLRRFLLESKVVSGLSHDYIIKVFEVGEDGNNYIVMEYLKYSLKNLLQDRGGKLPKKEALKIAQKIARALEYAHSKKLIHRDIKPDNILFRRPGHPVLTDFGLVRSLGSTSDLTTKNTILGTPRYMSPEQCRGEKVDGLSDIYSLGVVLFTMISGQLPYDGESWGELCRKHTSQSIPIPLLPRKAKDCQPLIELMMAKDKHMRIDAAQVCILIDEILGGAKSVKSKESNQNIYLARIVVGLITAFVIIVILILILA